MKKLFVVLSGDESDDAYIMSDDGDDDDDDDDDDDEELQGKSEQQQTCWSLQGCSVLNLVYKYNTIYQSSPMIKKKIIREQIILVVDLQPCIHRDVF